MGAAEPWEGLIEGESGPMLDRGLLFRELGIIDSRRIQEPLEEIDSLFASSSRNSAGDAGSPGQKNECLRPPLLLRTISSLVFVKGWFLDGGGFGVEALRICGGVVLVSAEIKVELVPGREVGEDEP